MLVSPHRRDPLAGVLAAALLAMVLGQTSTTLAQVEVNTCGQVLTGSGFLSADLDCTGLDVPYAVAITKRGSLDLRGFTITGGKLGILCADPCPDVPTGGTCLSRCTILGGGGAVTGAEIVGIEADKTTITELTVSNCGGRGIDVHNLKLTNSTVTGNGQGTASGRRAYIRGSVITGNGEHGVIGPVRGSVRIRDSIVTGNNTAPACGVSKTCCDLIAGQKPRIRNTSCDVSCHDGGDWDLCTLD
jgi:hypothetical protein